MTIRFQDFIISLFDYETWLKHRICAECCSLGYGGRVGGSCMGLFCGRHLDVAAAEAKSNESWQKFAIIRNLLFSTVTLFCLTGTLK